jgi:hypothetical protein
MENSCELPGSTLGEMVCGHRRLSIKQNHSEPNVFLSGL